MKKIICCILVLFLVSGFSLTTASANDAVSSEGGLLVDGRVLVPLRSIFEELGATVNWDQKTKTITATKEKTQIWLKIGSKNTKVNNKTVVIDVPAQIKHSKTYVPLRFISESLGAKVEWNSVEREVSINTENKNIIVPAFIENELVVTINREKSLFAVNGISRDFSKQEVINSLGTPYRVDGGGMDSDSAYIYLLNDGNNNKLELSVYFYGNNISWISFDLGKKPFNENWYKNLGEPFDAGYDSSIFYLPGSEDLLAFKTDDGVHYFGFMMLANGSFYYDYNLEDPLIYY